MTMLYPQIEEAIRLLQSINGDGLKPVISMQDTIEALDDIILNHEYKNRNIDAHLYALPILGDILEQWGKQDSQPEVNDYMTLSYMIVRAEMALSRKLSKIERVQAACFMYDIHMTLVGTKPKDWDTLNTYSNENAKYDSALLPFLVNYIQHRLPEVPSYEMLLATGTPLPTGKSIPTGTSLPTRKPLPKE